jgi:hypothetical protein
VVVGRRVVRRQVKRIIEDFLTVEPEPQPRSALRTVGVGVAAVAAAAAGAVAASAWVSRGRSE